MSTALRPAAALSTITCETREYLLRAIIAPMIAGLEAIVTAADHHRSVRARADNMLSGYAAHLATNRRVSAVLALDPGVVQILRSDADWNRVIRRQTALLTSVGTDSAGRAKATFAMAGMALAADPRATELDNDLLRDVLVDSGRRALGLPSPRRA